jgi:outer membrane protein OmpA-like peptidoglycan-associated protein
MKCEIMKNFIILLITVFILSCATAPPQQISDDGFISSRPNFQVQFHKSIVEKSVESRRTGGGNIKSYYFSVNNTEGIFIQILTVFQSTKLDYFYGPEKVLKNWGRMVLDPVIIDGHQWIKFVDVFNNKHLFTGYFRFMDQSFISVGRICNADAYAEEIKSFRKSASSQYGQGKLWDEAFAHTDQLFSIGRVIRTESQSKRPLSAQEIKATPERTKTEAERPPLGNEALSEKIAGDEKSSGDLAKENLQSTKERVAEPAIIEKDLTENSKPETVHIETGTDPTLLVLEEKRLRAAQMLADSAFYIFFEQNSNDLSPKAIEKLDRIYEILANNSAAKLTLNGYSDSIGAPSYNQMVSEIRANSVKSYLSGKGIKPSRLMAFGHGAQKFIASNKSAEGRRLNRRVEIELITP